jgi:hypothetical protein
MLPGIDTILWNALTEFERKTMMDLADKVTPWSLTDLIPIVGRDISVSDTFTKIAKAYMKARLDASLERSQTEQVVRTRNGSSSLTLLQQLRLDAFTTGCNLFNSIYRMYPHEPSTIDETKKIMAGWGFRQGAFMGSAKVSNELSNLAALGIEAGTATDECGRAAANYFEQRFQDIVPAGGGGGGGEPGWGNQF